MANKTIYPFGTDGQLPSSIGVINDLTTGGADKALSAEMGKRVAGREATDRQRIDAIVGILKKSVFTDDQTAAFAALDALANGIDSISFNASSHKFTGIGDTFTLNIVTDPAGKTAQVTWATSNASVATINNGVVTSIADGSAVITATTTDGKVAVCHIEVVTVVINGVSLNKSTLTLNGNDANETLIATTNPTGYESGVQWSSSDPTKATVDNNGKVTAVANGSAVITASIGGHSAACQVTVTGVMQTFHVSVGTLSNVTIEDGQSNAITNGQAILEGSALTINFVPAASHEISALSVVMGNTTLDETDATDGVNGAKVITIASVTGDIAISASAIYVRPNLINSAAKLTRHGVVYNTQGQYAANSSYECYIVPLEFGKRYDIEGFDWKSKGGTGGGYSIALVKSDGEGGYTNLLSSDITGSVFSKNNTVLRQSTYVYRQGDNNWSVEKFILTTPVASDMADGINGIYLAINTRFGYSVDISADIAIYEHSIKTQYSADDIIKGYGLAYPSYGIGLDGSYNVAIIKAEKGTTYSYSGLNWSDLSDNGNGFCIALLKKVAETDMISNLVGDDIASGAAWLSQDSFFTKTNNVIKARPNASGTFTIPVASDLVSDTDIYIAITTSSFGVNTSSTFTITKQ